MREGHVRSAGTWQRLERLPFLAPQHIACDRFHGFRAEIGEGRHPARPPSHHGAKLLAAHRQFGEGRESRRSTAEVVEMAGGAIALIQPLAVDGSPQFPPLDQAVDPSHLVDVHIQQPRCGIEGLPAPFGPSVKSGEDNRSLQARRREHPVAANLPEALQDRRVRLRRARGQIGLGQALAAQRRRLDRHDLPPRQDFPGHIGLGGIDLRERKQGLARLAVEDIDLAHLGGDRHGIDQLSVAHRRDENRRRGNIHVPDVVPHELVVPNQFAAVRSQAQQGVGVQVVSRTIAAPEIEGRRASARIHQPAVGVESQARPGVGTSEGLPAILRPALVAGLSRVGNRVEGPAPFSRACVVRPDVAGRAGQGLADRAAQDQQVAVDDPGRSQADRERSRALRQVRPEVDRAIVAEARHRLSGARVQCIQQVPRPGVDARVVTIAPVHESAVLGALRERSAVHFQAPRPHFFPGRGVECEDAPVRAGAVQQAVNHDRVALDLRTAEFVTGLVGPGDLQLGHVAGMNLVKARILNLIGTAPERLPALISGCGRPSHIAATCPGQADCQK